ncbi:hypothetical protein A0U94_00035 [Gluconobacter albidus]|nr:hypothetical protein A0U94_00035 [Gluconobacter albidus]
MIFALRFEQNKGPMFWMTTPSALIRSRNRKLRMLQTILASPILMVARGLAEVRTNSPVFDF